MSAEFPDSSGGATARVAFLAGQALPLKEGLWECRAPHRDRLKLIHSRSTPENLLRALLSTWQDVTGIPVEGFGNEKTLDLRQIPGSSPIPILNLQFPDPSSLRSMSLLP